MSEGLVEYDLIRGLGWREVSLRWWEGCHALETTEEAWNYRGFVVVIHLDAKCFSGALPCWDHSSYNP